VIKNHQPLTIQET